MHEHTPSTPRVTPLAERHRAAGARMVPFAGWSMPVQYTGILEEHHATRRRAGLFDTCHMGEVRVRGRDAARLLGRTLTRPMDDLPSGRARYALLCAEDGTVLDDTIAYRLGEADFWIVTNAGTRAADVDWLRAHAAGDCAVEDESDATGKIDLQGPAAATILAPLCPPGALDGLRRFGFADMTVAGRPARVSRSGYTGEDGFEIFCATGDTTRLWDALLEAGRPAGLLAAGLGARDTLRLEACLPLVGHELTRFTTPLEAGLDWAVNLDAPFIGAEALRRQSAEGIPRRLIPFQMPDRRAARADDRVFADETAAEPIGIVTSGCYCPTLDAAGGMAYVSRPNAEPDARVCIESRGKRLPTRLATRPLYRRR